MYYCGISVNDPPVDGTDYHCIIDTTTSSILFLWMLIPGSFKLNAYRRKSSPIKSSALPKTWLYTLQVYLHFAVILESILRLVMRAVKIEPKVILGYHILYASCTIVSWSAALLLLHKERTRILPKLSSHGHSHVLLFFWTTAFVIENIGWFSSNWWFESRDSSENIDMSLWFFRYAMTAVLFFLGLKHPGLLENDEKIKLMGETDIEETLLEDYTGNYKDGDKDEATKSTWSDLSHKCKVLMPYMWPRKNRVLQISIAVSFFLLVCGRVANLFIPIYYKLIVDSLTYGPATEHDNRSYTGIDGPTYSVANLTFRWDYILINTALRYAGGAGSVGLFNNLRAFIWIDVAQHISRELGVAMYQHLHGLSLRWHLSRKTGEVLRIMDRGAASVPTFIFYMLFQIIPTFVDILVAIVYFTLYFDHWFALVILVTLTCYSVVTLVVTEWRTKFRRKMNTADNERNAKGVDSLLNFETVKYYGAEDFEVNRYLGYINKFQKQEKICIASLSVMNTAQNFVINSGYCVGALLCAWYIVEGKGLTVGDFALFSSYIIQLYTPLNMLGTYYRLMQTAFVDTENMIDLLSKEQEVIDLDESYPLVTNNAHIKFENVCFSYLPYRPILKSLSFEVPQGHTVAIVGPTGSGKSTIIRLLFRFYDINSGLITIGGHDISKVTQKSLRKNIGVVPQDIVLFNESIGYNIRYARVNASDEEVENAAMAADIHAKIMTFPEAYETVTGERGLQLSGGEKQRVGIARSILKDPQIVLLDEATSAVDTQTETNIRESLAKICENKTTIIVAHRLSTIIHADNIIVLRDGEIVEQGTHAELLAAKRTYAELWQKQLDTKAEAINAGI